MSLLKWLAVVAVAGLVQACGGGGGSSGTASFGSGSGTGTGTGTGTGNGSTASPVIKLQIQRAGVATIDVSSSESVTAVATVTDANGAPVTGIVVSFAESGSAALLRFAPTAATALTDASGQASVDVAASDVSKLGATTVTASAAVSDATVSAASNISLRAGSTTTAATPAAINFSGSVPADKAIVIKGSGGNGRSESAILTFQVVDASNAPIKGIQVSFALNESSGNATLQNATGVSDASGNVTATVSSGTQPASVVVTAKVSGQPSVTSQSDSLIISNDVAIAAGFEVVAAKYNLDGRRTGDPTTVSAFIRDVNGNPVADGVAVNFVTDYGAVASSTLGGCVTTNGQCSVPFIVQDPRGDGLATIIGTVRVGSTQTLTASIQINMAGSTGGYFLLRNGAPVQSLTMTSCKQTFLFTLADAAGRSVAAGTTVAPDLLSTGAVLTVKSGSPVLDVLGGFAPTEVGLEIDLTSAELSPACKVGGAVGSTGNFVRLKMTTPAANVVYNQSIALSYPQ